MGPDPIEFDDEIRGHMAEGAVDYFQVGMKVGFRLDS